MKRINVNWNIYITFFDIKKNMCRQLYFSIVRILLTMINKLAEKP